MRFIRPVPVTEARLVSSTVPDTVPEYDPLATYAMEDLVRSGTRIFESQADGNTGHALDEAPWWLDVLPTNRWAAFDNVNTTATTGEDVSFNIRPGEVIDGVALLAVSAASATIVAVSDVAGEVFNRTIALSNVVTTADFYAWFFEPITRNRALVVNDIPRLSDIAITITLDGESLSLGTFVMGNMWQLGSTEMGARIGIRDYSRKENDDFGNQILVERAYARRGNFTVWCDNDMVDANADILSEYRATNLVWIGDERFTSTIIFGWMKTWEGEIAYATESVFTLELEGLT